MLASNLMSDANVATLATKTFFKFGGRPYFPQAQAPPPVNPQYNPYNPNPLHLSRSLALMSSTCLFSWE